MRFASDKRKASATRAFATSELPEHVAGRSA
jgi:hypothetical protein